MYRRNDRLPKPPTVLQYRTRWFRPWFVLVGTALITFGLVVLGGTHATRIRCARSGDEAGLCHVRRYALVGSIDVELSPNEIASFDVRIRTSSKGAKFAEVRLVTTRGYGVIDLESGMWGSVRPDRAHDVAARFTAFQQQRVSAIDEWLSTGPFSNVVLSLGSLFLCALGGAMLREQLAQRRPIRLVVDHEREVVGIGKREIPFAEIDDVTVELGRAHFWSSRKNEHVPGHRLVVVRRFGDDVPATREFRAGDRGPHDGARKALLLALGRAPK
ncbi:MAG: hypothetical protein KIS78_05260 [Labilithrix sp.]|nr:hypothetical protein [Labilithrix sp.]